MSGMNPDANINVVAVYSDGQAAYYGHADVLGLRRRLYSKQFPNRGAAALEAAEYEAKQREERARKGK